MVGQHGAGLKGGGGREMVLEVCVRTEHEGEMCLGEVHG